jgi:hypothetical protein
MEFTLNESMPEFISSHIPTEHRTVTQEERDGWIEAARVALPFHDTLADTPVQISISCPGRPTLDALIFRRGAALATVFVRGPKLLGLSLFLAGRNGDDDMEVFRLLEGCGAAPLDPKYCQKMLSKDRPVAFLIYLDTRAPIERDVACAALGLAFCVSSDPIDSPLWGPAAPPTPEQLRQNQQSMDRIYNAFEIMHNESVRAGHLTYDIRSTHRLTGRLASEIRGQTLTVYGDGRSVELTVAETVAAYILLGDSLEKFQGTKYLKVAKVKSNVNIRPPDSVIEDTLKRLRIQEP